jgi:methanethiol S-methyltransferase
VKSDASRQGGFQPTVGYLNIDHQETSPKIASDIAFTDSRTRFGSKSASKEKPEMNRIVTFFYGAGSYIVFFASFLYAIGFLGNFAVPKSMDSPAEGPWQTALAIDLGLLSLFAVQHSVMARPAFKRLITRIVPVTIERSTYVLASSLALLFLFWQWRPLGGAVWNVQSDVGRVILYGGFAFGWMLVLGATVVINHFDLFGLRQVWRHLMGQPQQKLQFVTPLLYRIVRHPLYVGWFFTFWCTPVMTVTHLFFALVTTAYILVAIQLEERDLMKEHPEYAAYRKQVPMLVPRMSRQTEALRPAGMTRG